MSESQSEYKTAVSIYINGTDFDPKLIQGQILLDAKIAHKSGESKTLKTGQVVIHKTGVLAYSIYSNDLNIDNHITRLMDSFTVKYDLMKEDKSIEDAYLDIFVANSEAESSRRIGFSISRDNLGYLAQLGLNIQFTT